MIFAERLARILQALDQRQPVEAGQVVDIASELLVEAQIGTIRFLYIPPEAETAHLGGTVFPAPVRFVAAHALNVARVMARVIRQAEEWRDDPLQPIIAALLHNAGMVRIPVGTLASPEPLSIEQRREIEHHPRIGATMVCEQFPEFSPIGDAIACHHERLDGTGYPHGYKGDQIPKLSRMLAAADCYAALAANRPHRTALDPRTALTDTLLYGEKNILDRFAVEKLIQLSFYPAGTIVEISDGSIGAVIAHHKGHHALRLASRPILNLLVDGTGHILPCPQAIDLAECEEKTVIRSLRSEERARVLARHYPEYAI